MAYVDKLYNDYFLEYASYYIKERAIPYIEDGLKPVQRRILHSLHELDDGKFHKVANIVGNTMKYHPHGDASINSALVVLANKDFGSKILGLGPIFVDGGLKPKAYSLGQYYWMIFLEVRFWRKAEGFLRFCLKK